MKRHRRGMALWVMVGALVLLGAFALLADRVFLMAWNTMKASNAAQTQAIRLDGMVQRLRQDVWESPRPSAPDPHTLVLANDITWSSDENGIVRRAGSVDSRQTPIDVHLSFAVEDGLVEVTVKGYRQGSTILLPSRTALLERKP